MSSSTATMHSTKAGSIGSMDSLRSSDPFSKSPRVARRHLEEIPEGSSESIFWFSKSPEIKDNAMIDISHLK